MDVTAPTTTTTHEAIEPGKLIQIAVCLSIIVVGLAYGWTHPKQKEATTTAEEVSGQSHVERVFERRLERINAK